MFFLQESSARMLFPCTSYVSLLFLRTKLDDPPIPNGIITDFAPTLHRLWYGGRTKV